MSKRNFFIVILLTLTIGILYIFTGIVDTKIAADDRPIDKDEYYRELSNEQGNIDDSSIFLEDEVGEVRVYIDDQKLSQIYSNPMAEEYQLADKVIINGNEVSNVGIRTKGNSSLRSVANTDSERYSYKLSFDEYIDNQALFGLQKLNLNNNFSDPSYLREYISYYLMGEMGIPTPRIGFVELYINDELSGLYTIVEQVDETFLEKNFENSKGDLYKPETHDLKWNGASIEGYGTINPKTNEKTSNHSALINMLDVVNNGGNLEEVLDVDSVLKYFVVSTALVNLDSYQGGITHNYYLYEEDGVFSIIPWDLNMSLGGFSMGGTREQVINFMIDEPTSGDIEDRPLVYALFQNESYIKKYHSYMEELISGPMAYENIENMIDELSTLIAPYVEKDPTKFYTYEQFLVSLESDQEIQDQMGDRGPGGNEPPGGGVPFEPQGKDGVKQNKPQNKDQMKQQGNNNPPNEGPLERGTKNSTKYGLKSFFKDRIESIQGQLKGTIKSKGDGSGNGVGDKR